MVDKTRKARLKAAVKAVTPTARRKKAETLRKAAVHYDVPRSTVNRWKHKGEPDEPTTAHLKAQGYLDPATERSFVDYIKYRVSISMPRSIKGIREDARELKMMHDPSAKMPSQNWHRGLLKRHPELKTDWSKLTKNVRHDAVTKENIMPFYDQVAIFFLNPSPWRLLLMSKSAC